MCVFNPKLLLNPTEDFTSARPRRELKVAGLAIPLVPPSPTSCRTEKKTYVLLLFPLR